MNSTPTPADVAHLVPDEPRWIDLNGLLLSGRCDIWSEVEPARGFVALSHDYPFASLFGSPDPELVRAATAAGLAASSLPHLRIQWQLLAIPESRPLVETALPGWRREGIVIHRPRTRVEWRETRPRTDIRLLADGHRAAGLDLDHVHEESRYELDWVSKCPMAVAVAEGLAVSFCYAAFTTERFWDVSVETLEPYRRRGLAGACFRALAAHMAKSDTTPTWGAMLDNPASLGLAAKLGFVRDSRLDGWSPGASQALPNKLSSAAKLPPT